MKIRKLENHASIFLTKTKMTKGCPDCTKSLKQFARLFGVNWETMQRGDKITVPLMFLDGTETTITFYVVSGSGGRKDCRFNIPATILKAQATVGDTITFTYAGKNDQAMLCVNVTRQPELNYLLPNQAANVLRSARVNYLLQVTA